MSSLFRIYTDCLANFIDVFLFFRFVDNNRQEKASVKYKIFILCLYFLYSVPNFYIPAFSTIIDFFFLIVITYPELKKSFCIFIKFQIYAYTSMTIILFLHSLLFNDRITLFTSTIYEEYKFIIVSLFKLQKEPQDPFALLSLFQCDYFSSLPFAKLCHALYLPQGAGIANNAVAVLNLDHTCSFVYFSLR